MGPLLVLRLLLVEIPVIILRQQVLHRSPLILLLPA
jgi:hypothetical protein